MYENEIIRTEEMISKLIEMVDKPFIGVDIAQSQDQSAIIYISNSRKLLNCKNCLYCDNCDKQNTDGLVYCFRKPRCVCIKCKLRHKCNDVKDGVLICPNFIPIQEISKNDYMR